MLKKVLIGIHNEDFLEAVQNRFYQKGYEVKIAGSVEEMIQSIHSTSYKICFMDVNFTELGAHTCEPAKRVYSTIKQNGNTETKFMSVTGLSNLIIKAKNEGIPVCEKPSDKLSEFFKSI